MITFIKKTLNSTFTPLSFSLCLISPAHSFSATTPNQFQSVFKEGHTYEILIGQNNQGGSAFLVLKNGKFTVTVPLRFVGGILFGKTTSTQVQNYVQGSFNIQEAYFKKNARSIPDIPALKNRVIEMIQQIEAIYKTEHLELKIEPYFVDDEKTLINRKDLMGRKDIMAYNAALFSGVQRNPQNGSLMTVILTPTPNPEYISPTSWNPYDEAYLFAHELGHLLGIASEGFMLEGYPVDGLMTDEYSMRALREINPHATSKMNQIDFNSLILGCLERIDSPLPIKTALKVFSPTIESAYSTLKISPSSGSGYYGMTHEERLEVAKNEVKAQYQTIAPCLHFLQ